METQTRGVRSECSKMEDLKTAMHEGNTSVPIVAHPLIWNVTDGVGVGHGPKVPSLPENYLVSMRDLEKAEKIGEKYREKIESLMNAARVLDRRSARAVRRQRRGMKQRRSKKGLGDMVGIKRI